MIDLQPEVKWYMRPYLLDFLLEIHQTFRLEPQTLFLAVNIVDKYCSKRVVFKRHYQLVGCTALWLAAKYEDKKSRVPTLKEMVIMCRNAYDAETFIQMERHILTTLEWNISHASLEDCLQLSLRNSIDSPLSSKIEQMARFFCEISLYNRILLQIPPSLIAVSSHLLAASVLGSYSAVVAFHCAAQKHNMAMDDDATFDEDLENQMPEVVAPFLSGYSDITLNLISKITILLVQSFEECSEAIKNKHTDLVSLVSNFMHQHNYLVEQISSLGYLSHIDNEISEHTLLDILTILQLNSPQREQQILHHHLAQPQFPQSSPLTTPPSASSMSVFSEREYTMTNDTPLTSPVHRSEGTKRKRNWIVDESPIEMRQRGMML
jgi:hypothetical protein